MKVLRWAIVSVLAAGVFYFSSLWSCSVSAEESDVLTGWQQDQSGNWYYYDQNGNMLVSQWMNSYYLKADGVMAISEWVDGGQHYVGEDGKSMGHHGNGDYYLSIYHEDEIDKVIPFIKQSLEINKK